MVLLVSWGWADAPWRPWRRRWALFEDNAFAPPSERVDTCRHLALSPEMQQFLDAHIAPSANAGGARLALMESLYTDSQLKLEYDAEGTRTPRRRSQRAAATVCRSSS